MDHTWEEQNLLHLRAEQLSQAGHHFLWAELVSYGQTLLTGDCWLWILTVFGLIFVPKFPVRHEVRLLAIDSYYRDTSNIPG